MGNGSSRLHKKRNKRTKILTEKPVKKRSKNHTVKTKTQVRRTAKKSEHSVDYHQKTKDSIDLPTSYFPRSHPSLQRNEARLIAREHQRREYERQEEMMRLANLGSHQRQSRDTPGSTEAGGERKDDETSRGVANHEPSSELTSQEATPEDLNQMIQNTHEVVVSERLSQGLSNDHRSEEVSSSTEQSNSPEQSQDTNHNEEEIRGSGVVSNHSTLQQIPVTNQSSPQSPEPVVQSDQRVQRSSIPAIGTGRWSLRRHRQLQMINRSSVPVAPLIDSVADHATASVDVRKTFLISACIDPSSIRISKSGNLCFALISTCNASVSVYSSVVGKISDNKLLLSLNSSQESPVSVRSVPYAPQLSPNLWEFLSPAQLTNLIEDLFPIHNGKFSRDCPNKFPLVIAVSYTGCWSRSDENTIYKKDEECIQYTILEVDPVLRVVTQLLQTADKLLKIEMIFGLNADNLDDKSSQDIGSTTKVSSVEAENLCVICLEEPKDTVVLPCRHLCMCKNCADMLRTKSAKCPVCRTSAHQFVQF